MKSSKYEYQLVTMPRGQFGVRYRENALFKWEYSKFKFDKIDEAREFMTGLMADDDFEHKVVEV